MLLLLSSPCTISSSCPSKLLSLWNQYTVILLFLYGFLLRQGQPGRVLFLCELVMIHAKELTLMFTLFFTVSACFYYLYPQSMAPSRNARRCAFMRLLQMFCGRSPCCSSRRQHPPMSADNKMSGKRPQRSVVHAYINILSFLFFSFEILCV